MRRATLAALAIVGLVGAGALADSIGGSGQGVTSAALDLLLGSGTGSVAVRNSTSWTALTGTLHQVLHLSASGAPTASQVDLTADVTGTLPSANAPAASNAALGYAQCDGATLACSTGVASSVFPVQVVTVAVSSAELLAIHTTPKQIIPAPGAGKMNVIVKSIYDYTYNSTTYTGCAITLYYGNAGTTATADGGAASMIVATVSKIGTSVSPATLDTTTALNAGIYLNATANCTVGNGTLALTAYYVTITP